ncbi:FliM/FliN family flagellar motor C-terminal domain-containing protein [Erythrobacter sp. YT30]|uniref:FliM/FliN family flagellar motor C-terminal domain-containing protein n=1 Tax=Erythrobacter sp. YT30 TaxID=1735012 RepID=UPI00076C3178|nr:flagellar motor switch protein FliM [Erythrobacter sp. YT30]KWV91688.1 hypothetical protein AUC45_10785 [Erythrobacter sp. YT30]
MNLSPDMAEAFANARPQAQHCSELIKTGPRPEEQAESLAVWRRDIGRELSQDLSELLSGARLSVTVSEPESMAGSDVFSRIGAVAANCLLRCGKDDHTLLLSFDFPTAIALTDRSFGGDGKTCESDAVEQLPRSAAMLTDSAAKIIAQVIARVSLMAGQSGGDGAVRSLRADVIVRSESSRRLKPFEPETPCSVFTLDCTEEKALGGPLSWKAILAVPDERLEKLLPGAAASPPNGSEKGARSNAAEGAFAAIPLRFEAVLAEFDMSLLKLDNLSPGDQIPIAMPREVPLRMGDNIWAHGSVGTLNDRMAIRVTRFADTAVGA